MYRILVVEDDASMASSLCAELRRWGYEAQAVEDFQNVAETFAAFDPQLVLLDVMLPFFNGYHWCQEIRKRSNVPIVFLSSAADTMNIVMAMNMGGDDFLAKPVDLSVMTAKVQAVLRRSYERSGTLPVLEHRGAVLNLNDNTLRYQGKQLELSRNEFRILQTLLEQKGKVVSRDTLMTRLWQMDCYVEENTLTVNVTRLRKKLEGIGLTDFILTRVRAGYIVE